MSPSTDERPDAELIELEPTITMQLAGASLSAAGATQSRPTLATAEGSLASLAGETGSLRRTRLAAAALFLAAAFAVVFLWTIFGTHYGSANWIATTTIALRCVIAAAVAGLLLSPIALTMVQLRAVEYVLFGSFTLLLAIGQYYLNLDLLRHGDVPDVIALVKNGVLGMVILMVLYGIFIPNDATSTAKVVLTMALVYVITLTLVTEHRDVAGVVDKLRTTEYAGSNILALMIGASLAIYGAYLVNGLRSDLHEALKLGKYQLLQKLGAGGMGEVYLAEHQLLKRPCALKLIKPEAGANPLTLARFEREVQSAARLAHPNTIAIYDYGHTEQGTFYYVMEYLKGMSLSDLVASSGPLPPGRVVYLFRQICAALAEAHNLGLVHRDLKPANVFVALRGGESDVAKVLDFGLVKLTKDPNAPALTSDMTVSGTPMFMAPEQALGHPELDARADIYALGTVMYHALTGQPPFRGESAFAIMTAHARDPVVPPSQVRGGVPADLEQVVLRCLAKKPEDRYPTVKALNEALAACACASEWGANRAEAWWIAAGFAEPEGSSARPAQSEKAGDPLSS
jgi:eukaryotic-like serine/threonine-protein kinase